MSWNDSRVQPSLVLRHNYSKLTVYSKRFVVGRVRMEEMKGCEGNERGQKDGYCLATAYIVWCHWSTQTTASIRSHLKQSINTCCRWLRLCVQNLTPFHADAQTLDTVQYFSWLMSTWQCYVLSLASSSLFIAFCFRLVSCLFFVCCIFFRCWR